MRKLNPKKYIAQIAPVVLCATCLFEVPHLCAQTPTESRASIVAKIAPEIGDVKSGPMFEIPGSTTENLNQNQHSAIQASVAKIQIDSKPEFGFPSFDKPEIGSRMKAPGNKALDSQAGLAFEDRISLLRYNRTSNPNFNSLPIETPVYAKPIVEQQRFVEQQHFVKSIAQPVAGLPQLPTHAYRSGNMEAASFTRPLEASRTFGPSRPVDVSRSVEAAKNEGPPTVVLRPSALLSNQENECVFEINEIKSSNDVSLKVAIPDSVTMIEVVPNRDSNSLRKFRIKMEQGTESELANLQPTSEPSTQDEPAESQPAPTSPLEPILPFEPIDAVHKAQPGYLKNPFFDQTGLSSTVQKVANDASSAQNQEQMPAETNSLKKEQEKKLLGVRGFLKRISHTAPAEAPEQLATQELGFETDVPEKESIKHAHIFAPSVPVIAAQIVGPTQIDVNQTADFMIGIVNPMEVTNRNLEIELDVPFGMKIVLLDQPADFNDQTGVLHWRVKEIKPGGKARLRYRVLSLRPGNQVQRLGVRIKDDLVDSHEIQTFAKVNPDAKVNSDAKANELPFDVESEEATAPISIGNHSEMEKPDVGAAKPDVGDNEFPLKNIPPSSLTFDSIGS